MGNERTAILKVDLYASMSVLFSDYCDSPLTHFEFLYYTERVVEGIIFLICPSVCQSVLFFIVNTTPLKLINKIVCNFVVMKDTM